MFSVYKNPRSYFKTNGPITNHSQIEIRYPEQSNQITAHMNSEYESEPYWSAPFQGRANEPNVIYSKDQLPQKFYSKKIYIYGKRLHDLLIDYDAELIVENVSDTTDHVFYTVFLLKTSNIAPNAIDAMLQPTNPRRESDLDINELLNSKEGLVKTVLYEEPEKRGIVMIVLKPIPIQTEFITRTTKPETPLFTLFPKTYSIANTHVELIESENRNVIEGVDKTLTLEDVVLKTSTDSTATNLSEVKKIDGNIPNVQLECTMDYGEDDVNVVTRIDMKRTNDSATFFAVAASFFLVISTIVITPYMYFSMKCFVENNEKTKFLMKNVFDSIQDMKIVLWVIFFLLNTPFWLLIFFKETAATWGNFILSWIFWVIGFSLMVDGAKNKKTEQTIAGSMLLALLATSMFAVNHYSDEMNK